MAKKRTQLECAIQALKLVARRSPDLLHPRQRKLLRAGSHYLQGFCYLFAEVLYHSFPDLGLESKRITFRGVSHWYLEDPVTNTILDPTVGQFRGRKPPYPKGRPMAFLTRQPSRRARLLAERAGIQINV